MSDDDKRVFDDPRGFDDSRGPDPRVVEDELRATFARHEQLTPDIGPLRTAIGVAATARRRRRRSVQAAGAALAMIAVLVLPTLGRGVGVPPIVDIAVPPLATGPTRPAEPLNFLILGVDGGDGRTNGHRADTVLIVHIPADRSRPYLVSLPRDLGVEVPGHGFDKLSSAFYLGSHRPGSRPDLVAGAALTERTVTELSQVRFDATATLTYAGLRELTDALDGVRVCLPEQVRSRHTARTFPAGCQKLDGAAAQDLLRQRYKLKNGAHDRDRNGQRFAEALMHRATDPATAMNPVRVTELVRAVGGNLVLDLDGTTPAELFSTLRAVAATDAVGIGWTYHSERGPGGEYESLDPAESHSLFDALRGDTLAEWAAKHPARVTR
ncbi:LCP family protein [Plantactinospora sp. S1510]|uniref:LCP family protein n=1 Tax=Plantactinospora alkalitolerans TaxID=2789879 RepID=A0ABS0GWZ8_9ACTN|nr:LCP family protein [Plantactinospora alkalitolerans]MBF9130723.1 LCP family protein [Plantactinospora alkalitolerans]